VGVRDIVSKELKGELRGEGLRIALVVAQFNEFITSKLLEGAQAALARHGVRDEDITVAWVPGSFEISLVSTKMAASGQFDALVCLGAVIRGETDHYEHVAGEAAKGVAGASVATGVPVIFGVLTTDTLEQAINRAGGKQGNSGYNAGVAAIEMANLIRILDAD
jgi:6,7-dimethyl-8-ribityllumazine synthase